MQGLRPRSPHAPSTRPGEEQGPGSGQWSGGVTFAGPCSPVMVTEPHQELHAALPAPTKTPTSSGRFVLLVSGLGLGGGGGESLLGTQLLVDVVTGQLGDEGEQCSAAHVSRVILAGNLLSHNTQSRDSINKVRHPPACVQALLPRGASGTGSRRPGDPGISCPQALLSEGGGGGRRPGSLTVPLWVGLCSALSPPGGGSGYGFDVSLPWGLIACVWASPPRPST